MRYSAIVTYHRIAGKDGAPDTVVPVRVSKWWGEMMYRAVEWPELFGNHTSWVAEQVEQSQARYRTPA